MRAGMTLVVTTSKGGTNADSSSWQRRAELQVPEAPIPGTRLKKICVRQSKNRTRTFSVQKKRREYKRTHREHRDYKRKPLIRETTPRHAYVSNSLPVFCPRVETVGVGTAPPCLQTSPVMLTSA